MNAIERLREFAGAVKWGGECRVLHAHHGDFAGDCSERECNACRSQSLRAIADEMQANMRDAEARLMPDGIVKNVKEIHIDAPKVLDADGVEVMVGDTVYVLGFGEPLTVKGFTDDGSVLMSFHDEDSLGYKPSKLTHEQPDTWELLYLDMDNGRMAMEEFVRRCKALAEREAR